MTKKPLNIAIVSTNKDKYSETFIHNHINLLPGNIHFLYDGYLPTRYSFDKGITGQLFQNYERYKWFNFRKKKSENEKNNLTLAIEQYLVKNRIDVILCEYGPSGVEMMNIASELNIPLVVHFHGYDAYRNDILNTYGRSYKELFTKAQTLIAVSRNMQTQLVKLGCHESKVKLLIYGIDTEIFNVSNRNENACTFVACGRFVPKKSPQSTIKAFSLVLRKYVNAKLVMIGDGELLQECKSLTKQLKIEGQVTFKGILTQAEIAEEFFNALAFVQHSVTTVNNDKEGTPLAILEAMASGLPIISTKHGGIEEVVRDGQYGFLCDENDIEVTAEKMTYLLEDKELADEMGQQASGYVRRYHKLPHYINQLHEVLLAAKNL